MFCGEAANLPLLLMDFKWMGQCISFPNYSTKLQIIANKAPGQAAIYKKNKPKLFSPLIFWHHCYILAAVSRMCYLGFIFEEDNYFWLKPNSVFLL